MSGGIHVEGGQHAGRDVVNVAGDYYAAEARPAAAAIAALRDGIDAASLSGPQRRRVDAVVERVDAELRAPAPDKAKVVGRLRELTEVLDDVGALATAGERVARPLAALAMWAGPAAATLLKLLAG